MNRHDATAAVRLRTVALGVRLSGVLLPVTHESCVGPVDSKLGKHRISNQHRISPDTLRFREFHEGERGLTVDTRPVLPST